MDHLCYFFIVSVMLSRLLNASLWKGLTSWPSFVMLICMVVTFPFGILGQVWYLIELIPGPEVIKLLEHKLKLSRTTSLSLSIKPRL